MSAGHPIEFPRENVDASRPETVIESYLLRIEQAPRGEHRAGIEYALLKKANLFADVRAKDADMYGTLAARVLRHCGGRMLQLIEGKIGNGKDRGASAVFPLGPSAARLGDVFAVAPPGPSMMIEGLMPADNVGVEVSAGGTGKTTRHQFEHAHIVNALPLYERAILRPGPVLVVSKEDTRGELAYRYHHIARQLCLTDAELKRLADLVFIEDLAGTDERLAFLDASGNLAATDLAERLIAAYRQEGLSLVELDPMNLLGPGERFVNDGEAKLMEVGRHVSRELRCAVRYTHHVSKESARGRFVDAHAGRGGSAGADNARFVWVFVPHDKEDESRFPTPAGVAPETLARRQLFRLHVPKLTGAPPIHEPIWIERDGFAFTHLTGSAPDAQAREDADVVRLAEFLADEIQRGVKHTPTTLDSSIGALGMSRARLRRAIVLAEARGRVVPAPIPEGDRRGGRTHYLAPVGLDQRRGNGGVAE